MHQSYWNLLVSPVGTRFVEVDDDWLSSSSSSSSSSFIPPLPELLLPPPPPPPPRSIQQKRKNKNKALWTAKKWHKDSLTSKTCFYVEDVCHSSNSDWSEFGDSSSRGGWFYYHDNNNNNNQKKKKYSRQPNVVLRRFDRPKRGFNSLKNQDYIIEHRPKDFTLPPHCQKSTIENHLVLFSKYNTMLGEFYSRSLYFLWRLYLKFPRVVEHSQIYLHLYDTRQSLLESHHLFTQPFRQQQQQQQHPLKDFTKTFSNSSSPCQCMKRVIFCGYRQTKQNHQGREDEEEEVVDGSTTSSSSTKEHWTTTTTTTILEPGGNLQNQNPAVVGRQNCSEFRDFLRYRAIQSKPTIQEEILHYRQQLIQHQVLLQQQQLEQQQDAQDERRATTTASYSAAISASSSSSSSSNSEDGWTIVGLTQRSGRRRWRDLESVQQSVQKALLAHKILLVIVNLDDPDSMMMMPPSPEEPVTRETPSTTDRTTITAGAASTSQQRDSRVDDAAHAQLIIHGALDALIGIHGAQLTQAIWMKSGSLIVELLPYIPEGGRGGWTQKTYHPTPLGVIFHETDLNHVGYPLSRDSAPYCYNNNNNISTVSAATSNDGNTVKGKKTKGKKEKKGKKKTNGKSRSLTSISTASSNKRAELACWKQLHHRWAERDFVLSSQTLEMILRRLLIQEIDGATQTTTTAATTTFTSLSCEDYQVRLGKDFVLYNINCADKNDQNYGTEGDTELLKPHHYYWPED